MTCFHKIFCLPCSCGNDFCATNAVNSRELAPSEKTQQKIWEDSTSSIHDTDKKAIREPSILSATTTLYADEEEGVEYKGTTCHVGARTNDHSLYQAAAGGHLQEVKRLLASGFNPSDHTVCDWCPLHWAAHNDLVHGHEIVKLLVEYGADVNQVSDTGLTPLDLARRANRSENVQFLEKAGAKSGVQIRQRRMKVVQANTMTPWAMQ